MLCRVSFKKSKELNELSNVNLTQLKLLYNAKSKNKKK